MILIEQATQGSFHRKNREYSDGHQATIANAEECQGLMRNLFTSIAYDLNAHSIVSLKSSLGQTRTLALITTLLASTGLRASGGIKGSTSGKDRKLLARSLFDEFVYDLDHKRIVDFTIKSWAESFLMLRAALYRDEMSEEMKNRFNSGSSNGVSGVSSGGMFFDPNG